MGLLSLFRKKEDKTASLAKERLKIIVEHSRADTKRPEFLSKMRKEILEVVKKYVDIDIEDINTNLATQGDAEVLELNIILPDVLPDEPKVAQPKATQPKATQPKAAQPKTVQPKTAQSKENEPKTSNKHKN